MNVLMHGAEVEVLGPPSLRAKVRDALRAASGIYDGDTKRRGSTATPTHPDADASPASST